MKLLRAAAGVGLAVSIILAAGVPARAQWAGQGALYAPVYQTAIIDHRDHTLELTANLYVRNRDLKAGMEIVSVTLYSGKGKQLAQLLAKPRPLAPLASLSLLVPRVSPKRDAPSLVVRWRSKDSAQPPLVEVLIMGAAGQQGISLTTTGTPLGSGP